MFQVETNKWGFLQGLCTQVKANWCVQLQWLESCTHQRCVFRAIFLTDDATGLLEKSLFLCFLFGIINQTAITKCMRLKLCALGIDKARGHFHKQQSLTCWPEEMPLISETLSIPITAPSPPFTSPLTLTLSFPPCTPVNPQCLLPLFPWLSHSIWRIYPDIWCGTKLDFQRGSLPEPLMECNPCCD